MKAYLSSLLITQGNPHWVQRLSLKLKFNTLGDELVWAAYPAPLPSPQKSAPTTFTL